MKFIKNESSSVHNFSAHNTLNDEFFILTRVTQDVVFVGKNSNDKIIRYNDLPDDTVVFRSPAGLYHEYSIIVGVEGSYNFNIKVKENRSIDSSLQSISEKLAFILSNVGYENIRIDIHSRGNDVLYNDKKIAGCAMETTGGYQHINGFFQNIINEKMLQILNCIEFPQTKIKDKHIIERIGCLDGLREKFDELSDKIYNMWGYAFSEYIDTSRIEKPLWETDNSLVLFQK